jgi:subtilisin family serine protease
MLAIVGGVLVSLVAAGAQGQSGDRSRHVPGEVIIKLRGTPVVQSGPADHDVTGVETRFLRGDETRGTGWRVRAVRPLGENVRQPDRAGRFVQSDASGSASQDRVRQFIHRKRQQRGGTAPDLDRIYRITLTGQDPAQLDAILRAYRNQPDVEYVELNPIISACATPNDPLFASQWGTSKIRAPQAWDTCVGTVDPIVAVIDTGIDINHRDLQSNLWINEAELNGVPGVDDDENGYVDDIHGYNFVYRTNNCLDDHGHGTHCAGIIAAVGDNGLDVAGVCWRARVMPLKILDSDGNGNAADAATAIYYAVANGADVINASWGGPDTSQTLTDAIAYAERQGVVVVAAAGNENSSVEFYPAAYSTVIAVAATEKTDRRLSFSNYGDWVDIAAPGYDILSLRAAGTWQGTPQDDFTTRLSGTSMAAPYVSGACALMLAADPFLSCEQVRQIVTTAGDPIAAGITSSNRRLNVAAAMQQTIPEKGLVYFDRQAYPRGSDIAVLLMDSQLAKAASQTVVIETENGDVESLVLSQTSWARGVFLGTIASQDAPASPADGRVQIRDGQQMTARYADADDGLGSANQWAVAEAVAARLCDWLSPRASRRGSKSAITAKMKPAARGSLAVMSYGATMKSC